METIEHNRLPDAETTELLRSAGLELEARVGHGSSSAVYRARALQRLGDVAAGDVVAVKVLRAELVENERAVTQMRREGELGQRVRSAHVARIHTFETHAADTPCYFLIMEWIEGRTLAAFVADAKPAVEDLARRIGLDAAAGLAALHRLGVVHRDVKPENLVLTPEGQVKVVDLGLARSNSSRPSGSGFFGSVGYAAPEMLSQQTVGPAADLYSLGLVLFQVVTGHHPFQDAGNADEMIHAHLRRTPPRVSHLQPRVSALLEHLIAELLAKNPADRPTAATVVEALRDGEASDYWQRHERAAPGLLSRQQLRALRRYAPTPFFGRRDEMAQLQEFGRQLALGKGAIVNVTGPRGIGRRRLVDEWLDSLLRKRDDIILLGGAADHGAEQGHGAPFPKVLLDWFLRGDDSRSPQVQTRLVERILAETSMDEPDAERLADIACGKHRDDSPETRAEWLARGILEIAERGRSLVLRVERADRLSSTGRRVVSLLADSIETHRILVVLISTARARPRHFAEVHVGGLPVDDFVQFGSRLFDEPDQPGEQLRLAHGALGGNPGHLLEALEDLVSQGLLRGPAGSYETAGAMPEIRPPRPLLARLTESMEQLPETIAYVLKSAAILGEEFPLDDLEALSGRPELDVLQALSAFRGRVLRAERGIAAFRHRDYRLALLGLIPPNDRRRLYRAAAWVLEERGAPALEVGLHYSRAGEHRAAIEPLLLGLDRLVRIESKRAARRVAERVRLHLDAVAADETTRPLRLRWLLLSARAHHNAGRPQRAERSYWRAERLASTLESPLARARARLGLGELAAEYGQLRRAKRFARRSQQILADTERSANAVWFARCVALEARVGIELGLVAEPAAKVRDGLARLPVDEIELRAELLVLLAGLLTLRARFLAAERTLRRAATLVDRDPDSTNRVLLGRQRGELAFQAGDLDTARSRLEVALEAARAHADPRSGAQISVMLGKVLEAQGQATAATHLYFDAFAQATATRDSQLRVRAGVHLLRHGVAIAGVQTEGATSEAPALQATLWLFRAENAESDADRDEALQNARSCERNAVLPLDLRLRVLHQTGQDTRAQTIVQRVAHRLTGAARRRFLSHTATSR